MPGEKIGEAFLEIRPDTTGFSDELQSTVGKTMGGLAKLAATSAAAAKFGEFLGSSLGEAQEAQKVGAQTAAVLKSTGGAAEVSAKQVGNLATRLSDLAGIDDEVIQSGENVLLTFTNIKNGVGKGNDIFNQTTKAALNMSVAMKTDLQTSISQVGKALQDPVNGVTALRRANVQLSDSQEQQVKDFVAAGDIMSAQKVILAELNKEFAGSAKAQATPAEKAQVAWQNLQETLGIALLPVLDKMLAIFKPIAEFLAKHKTLTVALAAVIGGALVTAMAAYTIATLTAAGVTAGMLLPIVAVIAAIAGIIAIIVLVVKHFDKIKEVAGQVWDFIKGIFSEGVAWLKAHWADILGVILLGPLWLFRDQAWSLLGEVVGFFTDLPGRILGGIGDLGGMLANAIVGGFKAAWNAVAGVINHAIPNSIHFGLPFGLGDIDINLPNNPIPNLAKGGIIKARPGGTLVRAGEAGQDEAITPLPRGGVAPIPQSDFHLHMHGPIPQSPVALAMRAAKSMRLAQWANS